MKDGVRDYRPGDTRAAVVLVAGRGRRLGKLTEDRPKCLLEVGDRPILGWILDGLAGAGIENVTLVVGYRPDDVRAFAGTDYAGMSITYVHNDRHDSTNTAFSLWLARDALSDRVVLLEGDIVFEAGTLRHVLAAGDGKSAWAAIPVAPGRDEGILLSSGAGCVGQVRLVRDPADRTDRLGYKCAGIQVLTAELAAALRHELEKEIASGTLSTFADVVLGRVLSPGDMRLCSLQGHGWAEVDDADDLRAANHLFNGRSVPASVSGRGSGA